MIFIFFWLSKILFLVFSFFAILEFPIQTKFSSQKKIKIIKNSKTKNISSFVFLKFCFPDKYIQGRKEFFTNVWCVFDLVVAVLTTISMLYAMSHLGREGEISQASLPLLVLRFIVQPCRVITLGNEF